MPESPQLSTVPPTVLVVDDEKNIRRTLEMVLTGEGYRVLEAESGEKALEILADPQEPVDVAIFDLKLPGMSGLDALQKLRADEATRDMPVIVVSGHATVHDAVAAIKLGATDFFEKPLNRERVLVSVRNSIRTARLSRTVEQMRGELEARYEMIGTSAPMQKLFQDIDKVAPTKASVLITGESGTGKELVSRAIHRLSPRKDAPFVKVNCAAIPRELIESELFGHEKGAFTGAQQRKRGFFEQAHGGTLFLDEIGDMDLTAQAKVLRALQNGEVVRLGSEHVINVDVRVLAATNKDLAKAVQAGFFREDLFFRLDVFPIRVPGLRERTADVTLLALAFVTGFCKENGLRSKKIDPSVFEALSRRKWPGNVRELKNVVERAAILSSDVITIADLPEDPHESPFDDDADPGSLDPSVEARRGDAETTPLPAADRVTLREYREATERAYILETLRALEWNISRAAIVLGVERTNLHKGARVRDQTRRGLSHVFGFGNQIDSKLGGLTAPAPPPIDSPGRAPGVLAFHGFGGTTREVELCTDVAQELGLCARARLLPGHGSHARDLARTGFSDWTAGGAAMLNDFAAGGPVIACGLSMGALVAAHLALSCPERVRGLVLLANAAWLRPQLALPLRLLGALPVPNLMLAKGASDLSDVAARGTQISYNADPVRAAIELERGARALRTQLKRVRCPTLIIHGAKDRVCPVSNAARVASLLGTSDVRVVILPRSHHILTRDVEHAAVARELNAFFTRIAAQIPVEP